MLNRTKNTNRTVGDVSVGSPAVVNHRKFIDLMLVASLLALAGWNASAATILVRQDGSGNYTTIQAAVNAMNAHDTVLVGPGTYPERITFKTGKSGSAGSLTTIKAETPGTVEMLGFDTQNCNYLHVEGLNMTMPTNPTIDYCVLLRSDNFEFVSNYVHDVPGYGLAAYGQVQNAKILNNHIYNTCRALMIYGTNWLVQSNDLDRLQYVAAIDDADFVIVFGVGHVFKNNFLHGASSAETQTAHVDGFQSWDNNGEYLQHVRFEGNRVQDFYDQGVNFSSMYHSNSFDIVIVNNIFRNAAAWGVLIDYGTRDVHIYNNVFKDIPSIGVGVNTGSTGEVYNNIFYNVTAWDSQTSPSVGSKNMWYVPGRTVSTGFTGDYLNVNPQFVDPANNDFHLRTNSPAIDAGVANTNSLVDYDGTPRPQGAGWDLGIYEFISGQVDTNAPVISSVAASVATTTSENITWTTSEVANGRVDYGPTTNYGSFVTNGGMVLQHQFTLTNLTTGATYHYRVRSADPSGNTATSGDFSFVLTPTGPAITSQPQGRTNSVGAVATFSVSASGTAPLSYQWRFNNANLSNGGQISGATSNVLTITNLQTANAGNYLVVVANAANSVTSAVAVLSVIPAGSCQPAPSGLVGWWPGDGTPNDIAGTNNGLLQGGATATAAGIGGGAFSFDGTNAFVQVPDAAALRPTNFTIETWVLFTSLDSPGTGAPAGDQYLVFKQNSNGANFEGYALTKTRITGGDVFSLAIASPSGTEASVRSTNFLATNVWYHLAAVRNTNAMQLYVNGQLEGQSSITFVPTYGAFPLYFGTSGESYWDRKLSGRLDEVSLYNRALSAGEIAAIYTAGNSGKCKGAQGSLPRFGTSTMQNGNYVVTLYGDIGRSYAILASTNFQTWTQVTNVTLTNGPATVTLPPSAGKRFYRASLLP